MDDLSKAQIAIAATLLGWLLGQGAELVRSHLHNRRLKKAILSELLDVLCKVKRDADICEKTLYALKNGMSGVIVYPQEIFLPVFDSKYSEACLLFSAGEREGINQAYGHVRSVNKRLEGIGNKDGKTKVFEIYLDAMWAVESIEYFFSHNGKKQLKDDSHRIDEINEKFQSVWEATN